jgi:hypothetical protein
VGGERAATTEESIPRDPYCLELKCVAKLTSLCFRQGEGNYEIGVGGIFASAVYSLVSMSNFVEVLT